nr:hypothetical protein [Bosea sp. REN20]
MSSPTTSMINPRTATSVVFSVQEMGEAVLEGRLELEAEKNLRTQHQHAGFIEGGLRPIRERHDALRLRRSIDGAQEVLDRDPEGLPHHDVTEPVSQQDNPGHREGRRQPPD